MNCTQAYTLSLARISQEPAEAGVNDGLDLLRTSSSPRHRHGQDLLDGCIDRPLDQPAFAAVEETLGPVDVLINNAGITGSLEATRLHETPVDEWDRVMGVNVRGAYLCSRAALSSMVPRRSGHIITVASVAGMDPFPARSAYSVSKAAALLLARSIALDYAGDGIRSNAVCPGMAETPMTKWRLDQPDLRAAIETSIPIGRVAQPEEVAEAVALLASGRLAYMTGHGLVVDGGWSRR